MYTCNVFFTMYFKDSLYKYFTGTKEEKFFSGLKDRMSLSAVAIKERYNVL